MASHALEVIGWVVRGRGDKVCWEVKAAVEEVLQTQNMSGVGEDGDHRRRRAVRRGRGREEALGLAKFAEGVREFKVVTGFESCAEGEVERVAVDHVLNRVREEAEGEGTLLEHVLDEDEVTLVLERSILFAEPMVEDDIEFAGFVESEDDAGVRSRRYRSRKRHGAGFRTQGGGRRRRLDSSGGL